MNKKLMAVLFSALLLVSSFGFTSCQDETVEPNFENFPLDVQANLRWGTEYDTSVYLDLTITNNTDMTVMEAWYYIDRKLFSDSEGHWLYSSHGVRRLEFFRDGGLEPHTTIEYTLEFSPSYVYNGVVATEAKCERFIIWWIKYDKKGADWGDQYSQQHYLDEHDGVSPIGEWNFYANGHYVDVANSPNPF
jgi:hypothetical protein